MSSNSDLYKHLCRAEITTEYLHTNSTTHEFLFGALAELVDNSRDAKAKNLFIYTEKVDYNMRGGFAICFLDDGHGMSPKETKEVIEFGQSNKKSLDLNLIGQYGNGLKSGAMRLGNDLIVFTKKNEQLTILFLSRDFLGAEKLKSIIICLPSFSETTKEPIYSLDEGGRENKKKHDLEMELILKYSPYRTTKDLMSQFDKITGKNGTLCVIYSLKLNSDGEPEIDISKDPTDLRMSSHNMETEKLSKPEQISFREYVSILYYDPRMKIYIQNKKVKTKMLVNTLHKPMRYYYMSKKFKSRAEAEVVEATKRLQKAEADKKEATSQFEHYYKTYDRKSNDESREKARLHRIKEEAYERVDTEKLNLEKKIRAVNTSKGLEFIFGINVYNRDADGLYIYNSNRLIRFSERSRMQKKQNSQYRGIVGIVNVPYLVLEPTHNKQSFADKNEQQMLINAMSDYMEQYLVDCEETLNGEFWKKFGYIDSSRDPPLECPPYNRIRMVQTKVIVQCNSCLKWRDLPANDKYLLNPGFVTDTWVCAESPRTEENSCRFVERLPEITELKYNPERKQQQQQKEKEKEKERQQKRQVVGQNNYQDFHYDDEDEPPATKKKINQNPILKQNPQSLANSLYAGLNQKPIEKSKLKESSFLSTSSAASKSASKTSSQFLSHSVLKDNTHIANNENSSKNTMSKSKKKELPLKRIRFEEDSEATSSSTEEEQTKKKKSNSDSNYRPGQSIERKNMSKKSTSVGQVLNKKPVVVNDNANETNESSSDEMDNEESDVNEEYRNTLEEFNRNSKKKLTSNNSTHIVKTEPPEESTTQTEFEAIPSDVERFSLDSRTVQQVSKDNERVLYFRPDLLNKNNVILLKRVTVNYCNLLGEIADKMNDAEMKDQVNNFKDVAEVVSFPVDECIPKLNEYLKQERENSLRILKRRLITEHRMSETGVAKLLKDLFK